MARNKIAHSHDVEAREVYDTLSSLQKFFETFKEGANNNISQNKHVYIDCVNNYRLFMLERMVREEQIKQVLKSAENPS